jgi:hypothetical protein
MKNQNILTMMVTTIQIVTNYVSNVFSYNKFCFVIDCNRIW